jgi:hypothetical protein
VAGPYDIQRFPLGLLDVFNMKAGGQSPVQIAPEVRVTLEGAELYLMGVTKDVTAGIVVMNAAQTLFPTTAVSGFTVPAGQMWSLLGAHTFISSGVGAGFTNANIQVLRAALSSNDIDSSALLEAPIASLPASSSVAFGKTYRFGEFFMRPGDRIGVMLGTITGSLSQRFEITYAPISL